VPPRPEEPKARDRVSGKAKAAVKPPAPKDPAKNGAKDNGAR